MSARILCAVVLLCFTLSARAVELYEFEGYFVSNKDGADPATRFAAGLVGQRFEGWIIYDAARHFPTLDGDRLYPAPLISVYLETESGYTISSTNNDGGLAFGNQAGLEQLQYSVDALFDEFIYVAGSPFHGSMSFGWTSTQTGQLPEEFDPISNTEEFVPVLYRPNSWTLNVHITPQCPEFAPCDPYKVSTLKGHITRFGPRPKSQQHENFNTTPSGWTSAGGAWVTENGYYRNVANVLFTHSVYNGLHTNSEYDVSVSMASQWSGSGNTLGLLLEYRDSANFDELRLNALGAATYTRVTNGVRKVLRTGQYQAEGPGGAFFLSVFRRGSSLRVRAGPLDVFTVNVGTLRGGRVGLFASWNQARFYEFNLSLYSQWPIRRSDFAASASGWTPVAGTWTTVDGYFYSSSNLLAAIATSTAIVSKNYTIDASVLPEWTNTGNQGGLVYDYVNPSNYRAVLVACGTCAVGVAAGPVQVIEVVNGVRRVVLSRGGPGATGPNLLPRQWTTVGVRRIGNLTEITVQEVVITLKQPAVTGTKRAGLIARFNKVRFDDVVIAEAP